MPDDELHKLPNRIVRMMEGRKVFITGATGFLGKVLIEKLLRKCPGINTIYVLVRSKKGREPKQRVDDMFTSPLFDLLKEQQGSPVMRKVVGLSGDVEQPALGLSQEDRQLLIDNVTVVFHAAATIRFDDPLKKAVLINTRGTRQMLELATEMKKLEAFLHISTAYCHLHEKVLLEKAYPPPTDPHAIIKLMETMQDKQVESMTKQILGTHPNTYAFTKALSEGLVVEYMAKLPAMILRPSIVIPIWKDPLPGWTDNINGPTGLLIGAGKGVIRSMYCNQNGYADYLPVDIACNGIMVSLWNYLDYKDHEHNVINLTSSSEFKISWAEIIERGRRITEKIPFNNVVWYPGGSMKSSRLHHNICVVLFHLLPAILLDTLIFLSGNKPVLLRIHRRILKGFEMFEYYANNQWEFKNDNVVEVRKRLNERERKEFIIDGDDMDIDGYFSTCILASRQYIMKEMPETLPAARRHMRRMYWVDRITKLVLLGLLLWWLSGWTDTFLDVFVSFMNLVEHFLSSITGVSISQISSLPEASPGARPVTASL